VRENMHRKKDESKSSTIALVFPYFLRMTRSIVAGRITEYHLCADRCEAICGIVLLVFESAITVAPGCGSTTGQPFCQPPALSKRDACHTV